MMTGTVVHLRLENGYGFIKPDGGGDDVFFHARTLEEGLDFDATLEEMRVEYSTEHHNGRTRAACVRRKEWTA